MKQLDEKKGQLSELLNSLKFRLLKPKQEQRHEFYAVIPIRIVAMGTYHQLATFVTNDPEVVMSPWGAACTNLITWPFKYLAKGENKAVLGGWDPSARKFFNTDELTFTVSNDMFQQMVKRFGESFLTTKTWATVQKKIARSNQAWERKTQR